MFIIASHLSRDTHPAKQHISNSKKNTNLTFFKHKLMFFFVKSNISIYILEQNKMLHNINYNKPVRTFFSKNSPLVTIVTENVEKDLYPSVNANATGSITKKSFEFTSIGDMLITEVVLDHFITELDRLKNEIEIFKRKRRLFVDDSGYVHFYLEKKKLVSDYINCGTDHEKRPLKEKLVILKLKQ